MEGPDANLDNNLFEEKIRKELGPILEAVSEVRKELEKLADDNDFENLLKHVSLAPGGDLLARGHDLWDEKERLNNSIKVAREENIPDSDKIEEVITRFIYSILRGGSYTTIIQILRLNAFILNYASVYVDPSRVTEIVDDRPDEVKIKNPLKGSVMAKLFEQGQDFSMAVIRLRESFSFLGINFHDIHFLENIEELEKRLGNYEEGGPRVKLDHYPVLLTRLPEVTSLVWHRIRKSREGGSTNNTVSDVSLWGFDSKKYPKFDTQSKIQGWFV